MKQFDVRFLGLINYGQKKRLLNNKSTISGLIYDKKKHQINKGRGFQTETFFYHMAVSHS